jgi:RNA ligase (TIGR02306 family)
MSTFQVTVLPVTVENHPNADALELARIGAYLSVIRKGQFTTGDLVAYIPEDAIIPNDLIDRLGLTGKLAGSAKNRVKAVKLRGMLSQGICLKADPSWIPGQDVAGELGITKYEPVIPAGFHGDMMNVSTQRTLKYDIENFKRFSTVLIPGETVVMTEKCHGTFALFGFLNDDMRLPEATEPPQIIVSSKGLAAKGLAFRVNSEANVNNIYCRTARNLDLLPKVKEVFSLDRSVFILGEIFGPGVQDLSYGKTVQFRIFDIYLGNPGTGRLLND